MINNNSTQTQDKSQELLKLQIALNEEIKQIKKDNYKKGTIGDDILKTLKKISKHQGEFLEMFFYVEKFKAEQIAKHCQNILAKVEQD